MGPLKKTEFASLFGSLQAGPSTSSKPRSATRPVRFGFAGLLALASLLLPLLLASPASAATNGQALTPPMGWSSWNHFHCSGLNEDVIKAQADAMAANGMKAAGYQYVNLDDCWMSIYRDDAGNLRADPTNFPGGIPSLVSYIHRLGLKIGLYEDLGNLTCDGRAGSLGHYSQDAKQFAAWGIDYLKVDWCHTDGLDPKTQYTLFSQAMADANLTIPFSICDWGTDLPWRWAPAIANLWRVSPDISDQWSSIVTNLDAASQFAAYASPGAWNDPDMLEVGNGGMSDTEDRTHFTMWAMLSAPLIAGNDLTAMSAAARTTLINPEVIAVDQDPLGKPALLVSDNGSGLQVWSKQVHDGTVVALVNESAAASTVTANWSEIGLDPSQTVAVRDIWAAADLTPASTSFSARVPSHGVLLLKLGAVSQVPEQTVYEVNSPGILLAGTAAVQTCPGDTGYSCLNGYDIGGIGDGSGSVSIDNVGAPSDGTYNLLIYAGTYPTLTYDVSVNGAPPISIAMAGEHPGVPVASGLQVSLHEGQNTVQFSNPEAPAPNLDHIVVSTPISTLPGFNIVYPTSNIVIPTAGRTGATTVELQPVGGFAGTVQVSCNLPATMLSATCIPASAYLQGESGVSVSLQIATAPAHAANSSVAGNQFPASNPHSSWTSAHPYPNLKPYPGSSSAPIALALPFPAAIVLVFLALRRRRRLHSGAAMLIAACMWMSGLTVACGTNTSAVPSCRQIPSAPTGLTASDTQDTSTQLAWTPGILAPECALTHYSVYQNGSLIGQTATSSYLVSHLTPGAQYSFTVVASDSFGASPSSLPVDVKTLAPSPATPAGIYPVTVTATSGSIARTATILVTVE